MTQDEIFVRKELEKVYPQLLINAKKVCGHGYDRWGEDLLPLAITFFLEKPLEQQLRTIRDNKLENFITWIMNIQLKSNSSKHYMQYRKPNIVMREMFPDINYRPTAEANTEEEAIQCVEKALNQIEEPFRSVMIDMIFGNTTMGEATVELNIKAHTFKKLLNQYTELIQRKCQHLI